ncbi:bifunctional phosphopantothenoylcysteine decarboxylase/phosphopantothenate--cysteine ligase CoaBC [Helcococcus bovis]|uniref:bifunctional phosphopantothenoylcysteine decarboxylase/phosphopantothenate--cysteine ligase CoaBC n=1 Tax=Helcococcus bovis TaxID=3153252 RepID=UPI0038BD6BA8
MLKGKKILIGVSSGIAIYKVLNLISSLRKKGAEVEVIMTKSATRFINPITFETISNNKVYTDMFIHPDKVLHVDITNDVDLFLIAPATANTIAKVYAGIADNLLTTAILASKAPVAFAVSTNTNMLLNPITQRNINGLMDLGYDFIDSNEGQLACNTVGKGRMAEPEEILEFIEYKLTKKDLSGQKVIIASGPTISKMDPVRFITNYSSGKTGYQLAKNARNRGAEVVYITGRVSTPKLDLVKNIKVETNVDLKDAIEHEFYNSNALIMAAAPVDYEFETISDQKIKKSTDIVNYTLKKSMDILQYFGNKKVNQKIIGFAAETENVLENANKKLVKKNADYIIANDVSKKNAGFNVDTNIITVIGKNKQKEYPILSKNEVANIILDLLVK